MHMQPCDAEFNMIEGLLAAGLRGIDGVLVGDSDDDADPAHGNPAHGNLAHDEEDLLAIGEADQAHGADLLEGGLARLAAIRRRTHKGVVRHSPAQIFFDGRREEKESTRAGIASIEGSKQELRRFS